MLREALDKSIQSPCHLRRRILYRTPARPARVSLCFPLDIRGYVVDVLRPDQSLNRCSKISPVSTEGFNKDVP